MSQNIEHYYGYSAPRADFKPEIFDAIIMQKGFRVLWEQGMFCSCIGKESGQPDYNCPACKGRGYVYFGGKVTKALVTSINGHKEQERIGLYDIGTAYLTPLSTDDVGFRDRFTFLDFTVKFSEVIKRGPAGTPDPLRYKAIDIICLRNLNTEYKRGIDFELSKDGLYIEWINEPLYENSSYSILYTIRPVYIAINPVHELRGTYIKQGGRGLDNFVPLPKQFQIKREDFLEKDEYPY
jgi:hypothetical protein